MKTVLACTDLSAASDEAITQAHDWAQRHDADLIIAHVRPPWPVSQSLLAILETDPASRWREYVQNAQKRVADQVQRLTQREEGSYKLLVMEGSPHHELLDVADHQDVKLIVVSASSKPTVERWLLGSTAERILSHAKVPVLIARPSPSSGMVIAASDLSDLSVPAVETAVVEAARLKAPLEVVYCLDIGRPMMASLNPDVLIDEKTRAVLQDAAETTLKATLARFDAEGRTRVLNGDPKNLLPQLAEAEGAQLLIMGTHGETGLARAVLGSVAQASARNASCSVLVVRHQN